MSNLFRNVTNSFDPTTNLESINLTTFYGFINVHLIATQFGAITAYSYLQLFGQSSV